MFFLSYLLIFVFTNAVQGQSVCPQPGVQCSTDCNSVWLCSAIGATPIVTDNCQSRNLLCTVVNTTLAQCVAEANSSCRSTGPSGQLPIECSSGGQIPDPYNCTRGYTCSVQSATPVDQCECPANTYWNIDNQCGTEAGGLGGCCDTRPRNVCPEGAIDGTFGSDCLPQYYYVCAINSAGERVVRVLHCDGDQVYDISTHACINSTNTNTATTTTTTTTTTTIEVPIYEATNKPTLQLINGGRRWRRDEAFTYSIFDSGDDSESWFGISDRAAGTCSPYVPPNSTNPFNPTCSYYGQVIVDPNDTDCRRYAVCDENLNPIIRACEAGTHLDCTNGCNCIVGGGCPTW